MRAIKFLACLLVLLAVASTPAFAATRYWVPGGSGVWRLNTNNWSATSGGAPGASIPVSTDDVIFDANSGSGNYSVDWSNANCHNLTISAPSSGTVTFSGFTFPITGDFTILSSSGVAFSTGALRLDSNSSQTITTDGITITRIDMGDNGTTTGTYTLGDPLTVGTFEWISGNFNDGGFAFTSSSHGVLSGSATNTWTATVNESWGSTIGYNTTNKSLNQTAGTISFPSGWGGNNISGFTFLNLTSGCPSMSGGIHVTGTLTLNNSCTVNITGDWRVQTLSGTGISLNFTGTEAFYGPANPAGMTSNGGTLTLQAAVTLTGNVTFGNGGTVLNNNNLTAGTATVVGAHTLTYSGSEVLSITGTGTAWNGNNVLFTTSGPSTGTIKFTDTSASSKTMAAGANNSILPTVWMSGCGTGTHAITAPTTGITQNIYDIKMDSCGTNAQSLSLPHGSTIALGSGATLAIGGQSGHVNLLISDTAGTRNTLSKASGTISESFLSIKDSAASGGATFNAYLSNGNVNNGNNTGWNFNPPPGKGFFHSFPP